MYLNLLTQAWVFSRRFGLGHVAGAKGFGLDTGLTEVDDDVARIYRITSTCKSVTILRGLPLGCVPLLRRTWDMWGPTCVAEIG